MGDIENLDVDEASSEIIDKLHGLYLEYEDLEPIIVPAGITIDGEFDIVDVCTGCYKIILETWDHHDWCENYVDEPLNKFLKDGLKSKNNENEKS